MLERLKQFMKENNIVIIRPAGEENKTKVTISHYDGEKFNDYMFDEECSWEDIENERYEKHVPNM